MSKLKMSKKDMLVVVFAFADILHADKNYGIIREE